MMTKVSVVICEKCKGYGKVDVGHHEYDWEDCPVCGGKGRMKKIETYEKLKDGDT